MENNKTLEKAPFEIRWETFRKAYFEWARYNPYKAYPVPNRNVIWNKIQGKTEIPKDFVAQTTVLAAIGAKVDFIYKKEMKRRKIIVKAIKKQHRKTLKEAFLNLF